MTEIPILNAPVYPHGYVTGRYLTAVADGPDDDHLMDFTPAKGKVIFTPETVIRRHEGPSPALVVQRPVECPINSQGYLTSPDGWRGVSLIVGIYSVRFEVQGAQVPGPKRIQVKASHTQDAPLDLVLSMPEVVPPGSVVVVDETTAQRAEAAAARAEAVVADIESEVRAVVLASPELKGERGEPGEPGEPGPPGAVPTSSDYLIVGPGRPDQPATTGGAITGDEPVGCEYRSTDGAGERLFDWMKRPTGWEIAGGGSGSGIKEVSGTVTLDATGPAIREFYTTGAATFKANGADTLISSFTAVVWRRNAQGSWGYQIVQDAWTTPTPTPDTTAPVAGTLAVTTTDTKADLSVSGASDDRGYVQYGFSKDNGATWTAYQDAASYTFTGLTSATSYQFRHRVKDAAGNAVTGTAVSKTTNAAPPFDPSDLYPTADVIDTFTGAPDGTVIAGWNGNAWVRRTVEKGGLQWGAWTMPLFLPPNVANVGYEVDATAKIVGGVATSTRGVSTTRGAALLQLPRPARLIEADYNLKGAGNRVTLALAGNATETIIARVFSSEGLKVFRDSGTQLGSTVPLSTLGGETGTLGLSYDAATGVVKVTHNGVEKFTFNGPTGRTGTLAGFDVEGPGSPTIDNVRVTLQ